MGVSGCRADQGSAEGENLVRDLRQIIEQRRGPKFFGASFFWRTELEPARRLNQSQLVGIATSHNTGLLPQPQCRVTYPERVRQQSEHFGITLDETLKSGAKAKERLEELLRRPFIVRTRWAIAAGRGRETCYYGLVEVGGKSLAEILVSEGLARARGVAPNLPSGEKAKAYMQRLESFEREARQKHLGAWANAPRDKKEKNE
jgi:hypothetical protein